MRDRWSDLGGTIFSPSMLPGQGQSQGGGRRGESADAAHSLSGGRDDEGSFFFRTTAGSAAASAASPSRTPPGSAGPGSGSFDSFDGLPAGAASSSADDGAASRARLRRERAGELLDSQASLSRLDPPLSFPSRSGI